MSNTPSDFFRSIGVDKTKFNFQELENRFMQEIEKFGRVRFFCMIEYQGEKVGHFNINNLKENDSAIFHGQIWKPELRAKGIGAIAGLLAVDYFFQEFSHQKIYFYVPKINSSATKLIEKFKVPSLKSAFYEFPQMIEPLDCRVYEVDRELLKVIQASWMKI